MVATQKTKRLAHLTHLSHHLDVDIRWLAREADAGRIPHVRVGKVPLFDIEAVERHLLERAAKEGLSDG